MCQSLLRWGWLWFKAEPPRRLLQHQSPSSLPAGTSSKAMVPLPLSAMHRLPEDGINKSKKI